MGEIPRNYCKVVDAFSQDGYLYGSVFCDLGMNLSDEFYAVCKKAQSEMILAITQDLRDLNVQDFGSYVNVQDFGSYVMGMSGSVFDVGAFVKFSRDVLILN